MYLVIKSALQLKSMKFQLSLEKKKINVIAIVVKFWVYDEVRTKNMILHHFYEIFNIARIFSAQAIFCDIQEVIFLHEFDF